MDGQRLDVYHGGILDGVKFFVSGIRVYIKCVIVGRGHLISSHQLKILINLGIQVSSASVSFLKLLQGGRSNFFAHVLSFQTIF